jgi:hypothetical protein
VETTGYCGLAQMAGAFGSSPDIAYLSSCFTLERAFLCLGYLRRTNLNLPPGTAPLGSAITVRQEPGQQDLHLGL